MGAFRDASFTIEFGLLGSGKTIDQIAAFPNAIVFSLSRELKSVITNLGWHPEKIVEITTIYEVEPWVDSLIKERGQKNAEALKYDACILDDMTLSGFQTEKALRAGVDVVRSGGKKEKLNPKGWDLWTEGRSESMQLAIRVSEKLKQAGLHFAVNGHQRPPRTNAAGKFFRGGIDMPTDLVEQFAAPADMVAKVEQEDSQLFHKAVASVKQMDPQWATKSRFTLPERVPLNTGEILRNAGYRLRRAPGMEHHEDIVEGLAQFINAGIGAQDLTLAVQKVALNESIRRYELQKHLPDPRHMRWVLRDAIHRVWLRRYTGMGSIFKELA